MKSFKLFLGSLSLLTATLVGCQNNGSEDVPLKNKQARELYAEIAGRSYYALSNNYTCTYGTTQVQSHLAVISFTEKDDVENPRQYCLKGDRCQGDHTICLELTEQFILNLDVADDLSWLIWEGQLYEYRTTPPFPTHLD